MSKQKTTINKNTNISLFDSLTPIFLLVGLLYVNVNIYGDASLEGSNQFVLLIGAAIAFLVGLKNKIQADFIFNTISKNIKSISNPIIILLLVGALSGTWLLSGIIPSMIYYGFNIINASFFLPACVIISAIVAIATGSSWSTSATIGIALIGIGKALGFDVGVVAGAVISGAYFGDKMSPLSDTTNLAAAVAGSNLFDHIKYMMITTVPTICIALIFFVFYNLFNLPSENLNTVDYIESIKDFFYISPILFIVPLIVVLMIYYKRVAQTYLLDEKTISSSGFSEEINENEQKILSMFGKKRNVSNSEIMDLFLEKDKTKDFAVKKKNKTILSLNEKLFSVFKIEFISKKKSKSDSRQLTYFLNKKVRILEEGAI